LEAKNNALPTVPTIVKKATSTLIHRAATIMVTTTAY